MAVLASDNFNRPNENPLSGGGNWTSIAGPSGTLQVSNTAVQATTTGSPLDGSVYTGIAWPNDQFSECVLITLAGANAAAGPICRFTSPQNYYYAQVAAPIGVSTTITLFRIANGVATSLGSFVGLVSANDLITVQAKGPTISVNQNGIQRISAVDGTFAAGSAGIVIQAASLAGAVIDNWDGGNFLSVEPALVSTYAIDDLLSIVNDELHGKKNAFPDTQKIRHLNKGLDEMWKIMKLLKGGYWQTNNTPGLILDTINTDFILPADFSEVRLIEVTNPVDYVGIDVVQMPMTTALFKTERQSFRAFQTVATADSVLAIPGQLNYDIYGPDATNQMHMLFSRPAPVPLTLLIWYIRMVGHFSVPKNPAESLQSLMSPYVWNLAVYAAKSLLKSEGTDQGEFAKWEEQWSKEIDRAMPAAHERASADEQSVEGFAEM